MNKQAAKRPKYHIMNRPLLTLTLFALSVYGASGQDSLIHQRLTQFSVKNGMSYNAVVDIQQDSSGTIWFATADGLDRFNGSDFTIYRHRHNDKNSLQSNNIHDLFIDSKERLWVCNSSGLSYYREETDDFHRISIRDAVTVECVMEVADNKYLAATRHATYLYDLEADTSKEIRLEGKALTYFSLCKDGDKIITCTRDWNIESLRFSNDSLIRIYDPIKLPKFGIVPYPAGDDKYYVGTKGAGLTLVDFKNRTCTKINTGSDKWLEVLAMCHDDDGNLWIGSSKGVMIMDKDGTIREYAPGIMPDNNIRSIFKDSSGGVWIGTEYSGAMYWHKQRDIFRSYEQDRFKLQNKIITTLKQDEFDSFWVGTRNDGLYRFSKDGKVSHYPLNNMRSVHVSENGKKAYAGGEVQGLHEIDIDRGQIRKMKAPLDIMYIIPANNGKLWLGTLIGLYLYDIEKNVGTKIHLKQTGPERLTRILSLCKDKDNQLWIGAKESLSKYIVNEDNTLDRWHKFNDIVQTQCIYQSKDGKIWIGTIDGLVCIDEKTGKDTVEHPDGFQNSTIRGIEEDNDGNLWISSDDGLYRYAPTTGEIRRFGDDDGIRCDLFNTGAHTRDTTGKLYFGGIYGIETFNPDDIVTNTMVKRPIIDKLIVNNVEIKPGDKSRILDKNISITERIVLKHWQNSLTLGFSCPDMISEKSCRYSYMLEGLDKNWNNARGTEATYTNLSKGRYTFLLKAANSDGVWNEHALRLEIRVRPVWYKSTFAEIFALLLVISGITAVSLWYIRKVKKMKDVEIAQLTKNYEEKVQKSRIAMYVDSTYNMKPDDERFLLSTINCIEANIGNAAFTVENLAEGSCCSRGNLHLRLKNITGKSPVELIKTLRMKKACALLKDTEMPISDIAEQCGYQTPAYFITVFKNTFGETPGKYAARIHGK